MNNYVLSENKIRKNINLKNFLWNAKQEYSNMENKILDFQFEPVCATLAQITVLEATKIKQKSCMTDGSYKNGATVKNVKRGQPVKDACTVTKFQHVGDFI